MRDLSHNNLEGKPNNFRVLRVNLGLLSMILVLGLVYIFSVNSMATEGFQIKKLSAQMTELEADHKKLELQNSSLQSVSAIQQKTASLNLVPTTTITYLKDDNVALK